MKVGSIVYATDQGLGILAKAFYDHRVITDVIVVPHSSRPTHGDWYPDAPMLQAANVNSMVEDFVKRMDAMLFFETPFAWDVIPVCRTLGVCTILQVMYECMPKELPFKPDHILCPSLLDLQYYPGGTYIPVPVDRELIPFRTRDRARVFVHNMGHGGLKGRNGTKQLLDAMKMVSSPVKLIVRSQKYANASSLGVEDDPRVEWRHGTIPYSRLYDEGDVFVFPERFNGLSLPLQEAFSSGMCVMATNRFPHNRYLPPGPLINPTGTVRGAVSGRCNEFDDALVHPADIAAKIDEFYDKDISDYSQAGLGYRNENSWEKIRPQYMEVIRNAVANRR